MIKRFLLIIFLSIIFIPSAFADQCIDWDRLMVKYEVDNMPSGRRTILVQSFDDYTKVPGDDWLSVGIPNLLADYLSTGKNITVLFGPVARYHSSAVSPTYIINGMYQHLGDRIRVFVKFMQGGDLRQQYQLDIAYPKNKQLFETIGDTAWAILGIISPPYDKKRFDAIKRSTPVVAAYENYIRGLLSYQTFDLDRVDVAETWFNESKKADVNYSKAYEGLANLYIFVGMYNKQNRKPFGIYFEKADRELASMARFATRTPLPSPPRKYVIKMKEKPRIVVNRYLLGNAAYIAGLQAEGAGKWLEAANYFEEATTFVPEDALTWYKLSQMREKTGNGHAAAKARSKAFEINKCLQ